MNHQRELPQDAGKLEGRYANYFKVGHNAFEFVIDFSQFYPESEEAELCVRIITPPIYAKTLLETLRGAIEHYEQTFGVIQKEDEGGTQHTK
ncbi:MAG: hypothetical protein BA873_11970 [Desulfobulbaceae bacterium C00003063]|nr:MAG: hypothetical protein BA873_11970 [Desulfobulbaceae bacterium C00003063]